MEQVKIEQIKSIIKNCAPDFKQIEINEPTILQKDLGFTSVKMIQVICEIENEFDIEIDVGDEKSPLHSVETFGELIEVVEKYM